jgi:hypothetical protein
VDLGQKYLATPVRYENGKIRSPKFYGKEVRGMRVFAARLSPLSWSFPLP